MKNRNLLKIVPLSILLVFMAFTAFSQTKDWVGGTGNWENANNWNPVGVPTASDNVNIGIGDNVTIPADIVAVANYVYINGGGTMSIAELGRLEITGPTAVGITMVDNGSVFTNSGTIIIESNATAFSNGIGLSNSTFSNSSSGLIEINKVVTGAGIAMSTDAVFNNSGTINIGKTSTIQASGIEVNQSAFTNNAAGKIEINNVSTGDGILFTSTTGRVFTNTGSIKIGNLGAVKNAGIDMFGSFIYGGAPFLNDVGATIEIDNITDYHGIAITDAGGVASNNGFVNSGTVRIGKTTAIKKNGIDSYRGRLTNNASGVIEINQITTGFSIYGQQAAEYFNYGTIKIGNVATVKSGLYMELNTRFVNDNNALLEINNIATFGNAITTIGHQQFPCVFTNNGTIKTGNLSSIYEGINLNGTSTNGTTGVIEVNNTSTTAFNTRGLFIGGSFTNSGVLKIGNLSSVSPYGLLVGSNATFTNNNGASVEIDRIPNNGNGEIALAVSNTGTFTNAGNLKLGTVASVRVGISGYSGTWGTFNNTGTVTFANITLQGIAASGVTSVINNNSGGVIQTPIGGNLNIFGTLINNSNATVINNGTLTLFSGLGLLTNNGTVKGSGTIVNNGTFTNNTNSTIAPGTSAGTLTITGALDLGSTTYMCEINGTTGGTLDKLAVSGSATLTNATLQVIWGFTPVAGNTFTILTYGSRTGQFATVNIPVISGLNFTLNYNSTSIVIEVTSTTPTCSVPQNIVNQSIGSNNAQFTWNVVSGATGYELEYYTGSNTSTTLTPSTPSVSLTNLSPSTLYHLRVRTNCGNGSYSNWSNYVDFTTTSSNADITSAQSGFWYETTTWVGGVVPTSSNNVLIAQNHTVQVYSSTANCKNLTVSANSRLDQRGTLIIGGDLTINGTFNHAYDIFNSPFMGSTQIGASNASSAAGTRLVTVNGTLVIGNGILGNAFSLAGRMLFNTGSTLNLLTNAHIILSGWSGLTPQYLMDIDNLSTLNMDTYSLNGIQVLHNNGTQPIVSSERAFAASCNYTNSSYNSFNLAANNTYYFGGAEVQTIQSIILGQDATLDLSKIDLRNLEAINGGDINATYEGQFSNIKAGGGTTLYGDYTIVDNCNTLIPPVFTNTGDLSFDNDATLLFDVSDYAVMNIPIGANQNILGDLYLQNGKVIVKGGTLDLRNARLVGLNNTRYFETQIGTAPYNALGTILLPAIGYTPVNFHLGITLSNGTSVYAPVNIVSTNGNSNISINLQTLNVPQGYVAPAIQWNITPSGTSPELTITFTWPASAESVLFANNRSLAKVYHQNSSTGVWEELPTSAVTTNSDGSFSVTASNITTFSPFAVMVNNTVLKAELTHFTANVKEDKAVLNWQTANELNLKNFDIEKSTDGQKFEKIGEVKANNTPSLYQAFDNDFLASAYYRLKINDLDGKTDYSKVVYLEKSQGKLTKIRTNREGDIWIETDHLIESIHVVNTIGQVVKTTKDKQFSIADFPKGIYVVVVKTSKGFVSEKVLSPMK